MNTFESIKRAATALATASVLVACGFPPPQFSMDASVADAGSPDSGDASGGVCSRVDCGAGFTCVAVGDGGAECRPTVDAGPPADTFVPPAPADPCSGITCPAGTACQAQMGRAVCTAVNLCAGVTCPAGSRCQPMAGMAVCWQVNPCTGITCPTGLVCEAQGERAVCRPGTPADPCSGVTCPAGHTCRAESGTAVCRATDPCAGVSCPAAHMCVAMSGAAACLPATMRASYCRDADNDGAPSAVCAEYSVGSQPAGYIRQSAGAADCDDADARRAPGRAEICGNGVDEDCSGADMACAMPPPPVIPDAGPGPAPDPRPVTGGEVTVRIADRARWSGPCPTTLVPVIWTGRGDEVRPSPVADSVTIPIAVGDLGWYHATAVCGSVVGGGWFGRPSLTVGATARTMGFATTVAGRDVSDRALVVLDGRGQTVLQIPLN